MIILSGDFNTKVGRDEIFKLTIGNEGLHQDSNDKGVRIVTFVTYEIYLLRARTFPHRNTFINKPGPLLFP